MFNPAGPSPGEKLYHLLPQLQLTTLTTPPFLTTPLSLTTTPVSLLSSPHTHPAKYPGSLPHSWLPTRMNCSLMISIICWVSHVTSRWRARRHVISTWAHRHVTITLGLILYPLTVTIQLICSSWDVSFTNEIHHCCSWRAKSSEYLQFNNRGWQHLLHMITKCFFDGFKLM